jgi:glycolate oxidase FAD binding subunit
VDGSTVRRGPPLTKTSAPRPGAVGPEWELMRHVKQTLDPDNVFNPGRLFGDL